MKHVNPWLNPANPADTPPPLTISRRAAAAMLGISERTLWTLTNAKQVPHLRIGARVLYPLEALKTWLADRCQGGTTSVP